MSITAEQIEAVADFLDASQMSSQAARTKAEHARLVESKPVELVKLATAIRSAFYNDGRRRELVTSRDPGQWLRMAEAASSGEPVPRVFHVGDVEPEDRDTITLHGISNGHTHRARGTELRLKFGEYSSDGESYNKGHWWQVTDNYHTKADWSYWLEHYGPLTEVLA